jgi:pimeloyl-ACP methyl ester carboxylesterase
VTVPALVVIGDRDTVGPADRLTAALPQARMVVLKGVDHYATTSNFRCQDEVLRFLSE